MEINITLPGEKLALRLWESIEKSTIGLLRPWQIKRIAKSESMAEQSKRLTSEQTNQDIQDLKSGKKYFDIEQSRLLAIAEDTEISTEKMLISNEYVKILCKSKNVANAIKIAIEQLENKPEPTTTEEPINQDWLNEWGEHAGFISDKKMQSLWGKVLAGEVKKPGSFSLRTMQFLRNLSKEEANLIHKYLSYRLDDTILMEIEGYTNLDSFSLKDRMKLIELGITIPDITNQLSLNMSVSNRHNEQLLYNFFEYYSWLLIFFIDEPVNVSFKILKLTQLGQELSKLDNNNEDEYFIHAIGKYIVNQHNKIKIYKTQNFKIDKKSYKLEWNGLIAI